MNRRPASPPRDHSEYRREWKRLAQETLAALDAEVPGPEQLRALGDLAATARNGWTYPARAPEGLCAAPLATGALAWARQRSPVLREALAPAVRTFAETVLTLLTLTEPEAHDPDPAATRRYRADIDG